MFTLHTAYVGASPALDMGQVRWRERRCPGVARPASPGWPRGTRLRPG